MILFLDGYRPTFLAELFGVSRMTLTRWVHPLNRQGLAGLLEKPRAGRPTQLTARLRRQFGVPLKGSTGKVLVAPFGLGLEACPRRLPQAKAEDVEKFRRRVKKDSVNGGRTKC